MKSQKAITVKDLVLIGGGHAHVQVLRNFGMNPMPGVRVTLICREAAASYSGMLPGLIAGHYEFDDVHIDLRPLTRFAGAQFLHDEVTGFDLDAKRILCRDRPPVVYDLMSINTGSTPTTTGIAGAAEHALAIKPIDAFLTQFEDIAAEAASAGNSPRIGVVGGGAGGVELLLAVQHKLAQAPGANRPQFHLITEMPDILVTHNRRVRSQFHRVLSERGVQIHVNHKAERLEEKDGRKLLICRPGGMLTFDYVFWVTSASAPKWLRETGLALDNDGFIAIHDTLASVSDPAVYAAGDIAAVLHHPRPKSGVFAVRQGPPLAKNLRRALTGRAPRPFRPQRHFLSLITTGDKHAVASWRGLAASGRTVWRWKNHIDVKFMRRFNELPEMKDDDTLELAAGLATPQTIRELSDHAMRCGGCGAKVGPQILARVLDGIAGQNADGIVIGLHGRDDAAIVTPPPGKLLVQSVDGFRSFIDDPFVFGAITANHALNDLFAMAATPHTALALATLPFGLDSKVEADLAQMMAGAARMLADHDTALVGGHTNEGLELSLSFAVNGLADADKILRKSGMAPGQKLVMTKALGTGCLLAADMRYKARGKWLDAALASMMQSNAAATLVLVDHGATACTDVSGFGLYGHLLEMAEASGMAAQLSLGALPFLDGARETFASGIASSLQPQNERLASSESANGHASEPAYRLLFDPQTAGGLLASVPAVRADDCVARLTELGYANAAIVGDIVAREDGAVAIEIVG